MSKAEAIIVTKKIALIILFSAMIYLFSNGNNLGLGIVLDVYLIMVLQKLLKNSKEKKENSIKDILDMRILLALVVVNLILIFVGVERVAEFISNFIPKNV